MKPPFDRLVLASGNAGKLVELRDLLGDAGFALHAQSEFGVHDADETGLTPRWATTPASAWKRWTAHRACIPPGMPADTATPRRISTSCSPRCKG